jgi:N-acetylmuramoyl-L-alanine amidase
VEATTSQLANPNRLIIELRSAAPGLATPPTTALALPPMVKPSPPKLEPPAPRAVPPALMAEPPTPKVEASAPKPEPPAPTAVPSAPKVKPPASAAAAPAPAAGPVEIPKAAKRTSTGNSSLTRALGLKVGRIVIDAGHGGHDQGTEGPKGLLEKDLVLDVALRLGKLIEDRMGAEVIYTRADDTFVPLEQRTALANEKKADLFLSIHANSSPYPRIAGIETFYLNFTDSKEALDVASRENASSQKSIFELQDIIQKITLHDKAEESKEFASRVQAALYAFSARNLPGEKNRGVKKAPFVVLIGASMPSVLAEIGFLSNPREEALLKKPDYRQKLAEALYRGVTRYSDGLSHFQVAQK